MPDAPPPYGAPTPEPNSVVSVIDGRAGRKANNALTLTFLEGSEEPIAKAVQGGGDGFGKKVGILFGFRNGAPGKHVLTHTDGTTLVVETRDAEPSPVTRGEVLLAACVDIGIGVRPYFGEMGH